MQFPRRILQLTLALYGPCLHAQCSDPAPLTAPRFKDVTAATGIGYRHETGAFITDGAPSRYMPETLGPGVALSDYDNDGDLDIFVGNSTGFPGHRNPGQASVQLYENRGHWKFADVTEQSGLRPDIYTMGLTAADYNGDGHVDILVTGWGGSRLFRNEADGSFTDVTAAAGLQPLQLDTRHGKSTPEWSTGGVFFDAENDGDLDLLVINYVRWSPDSDIHTTYDGSHKGYTSPRAYPGISPRLFIQEKGVFNDRTRQSGIYNDTGKSLGVAIWDFDNDNLVDIVVANDTQANFYYHNSGNGMFEEIGERSRIAYDENGNARAGMGIDIGDFQNNGGTGIAIGNFSREPTALFQQTQPHLFRSIDYPSGIAQPSFPLLTFGTLFADIDLDGWLDLIMANGHVEPNIGDVEPGSRHAQPPLLLGNMRNGCFADWSDQAGADFKRTMVGRGLAAGDLDNDGDLDLVITSNGGELRILRNDLTSRHYLRVKLRGRPPNTDAIGAKLILTSGNLTQRRMVRTGSSYLSHSELTQTFGLGKRTRIDKLIVIWPGGRESVHRVSDINRVMILDEP